MKEELERGKISKVGRQTLAQKCYEQIKQSILQGDIAPGERLQEVRMANLLNGRPAPVREAFRMLATEGLIRILPWKGAVVRGYSSKEILDVVQCRVALETLAMRLAYANMGEELTRRIAEELEQTRDDADVSQVVYFNANLHQLWVEGSRNTKLIAFVDQLNDVILRGMNYSAIDDQRRQEIWFEHQNILRALKAGDVEETLEALSLHIYNGNDYGLAVEEKIRKQSRGE